MEHWDGPQRFAPDLATALGAIVTVANALVELGDDAVDETFAIKDISQAYVLGQAAAFTGDPEQARQMLEVWWNR